MILLQEPKITFRKSKIFIVKVNEDLADEGIIPGMVFDAREELADGLSTQRYWINHWVSVSPPFCRQLYSE